jgi:hypothetical protein
MGVNYGMIDPLNFVSIFFFKSGRDGLVTLLSDSSRNISKRIARLMGVNYGMIDPLNLVSIFAFKSGRDGLVTFPSDSLRNISKKGSKAVSA